MRKVRQPLSFFDLSTSPKMWSPTYSTSLIQNCFIFYSPRLYPCFGKYDIDIISKKCQKSITCPLLQWAWREPQSCRHCTQQSPPRFLCGTQCSDVLSLYSPRKLFFSWGTLRNTDFTMLPGAELCPRRRRSVFWRQQRWSWSTTARDVQHTEHQGNSTGSPWPSSPWHHNKLTLYRFTWDTP